MKSFSAYTSKPLSEGYNIFPKNEKELSSAIKDRSPEIQKDIWINESNNMYIQKQISITELFEKGFYELFNL